MIAGKYIWLALLIVFLAVWIMAVNINENQNKELISPIVTITPVIEISASPSAVISEVLAVSTEAASPSVTVVAKITPTPTKQKPAPTPTPATSEEVNGFIERFAAQFGVDKNVLRHIALCESGFNSRATNGPYAGLYQFGPITWQNIRKEIGEETNPDLRYSAKDAVQTAAYALSKGKGGIWPNCMP